ncbi:uncharacterized protein [Lepeophtheirus salmonis]|nr:uncharacterized protein LOC121117379 [Lepeophtheirus salmonis]XP_040567727.1 uncharacterized protein LOC121117379 [Lepeophtheirus salmonis]
MAVPGILFGISEFVHFKHFRFGDFKVLGLQWSFMVKIMVLPLYVTVMIPFFFFITIWNYIKLISNIFLDLLGRDESNRFTTGLGLYIKFQSLEGMGETFLQIILQLYFLCILVFLGTGTLIAGINAQEFLSDVFSVTIASLVLSILSLISCTWGIHDYDRKAKNLFLEDKLSIKLIYRISGGLWIFGSIFIKILSILLLCLLTWVEVLSESLTETKGFSLNFGRVLPFISVGIIPILCNIWLHSWYLNNDDSFAFAHGILSAVFPCRFLHPDESKKTKSFLFFHQLTDWSAHVGAWLVFCLTVYSHHTEDFAFSNIFLPMLALLSLSPFLAALHWSLSLRDLYVLDEDETIPEKEIPKGRKRFAYYTWQGFILITRSLSFIFLFYVFHENYGEVRIGSFRLGLWHLIPYVLLVLFSNLGLHAFLVQKSSVIRTLYSIFLPNDFRRIRKARAREYILINTVYNGVIWALIWLFMTFYCWECTRILSIPKLISVFPTITILWLLQWGLTILIWKFVIEPSYDEDLLDDLSHEGRSWPSKVYSMTTAL